MFCCKCGTQMNDNEKFCPSCGAVQETQPVSTYASALPIAPKSNLSTILLIISAALMILGTLLPCYSVSFWGMSESFSYIEGDGIFVILAAVAVVVLAVIKKPKFAPIPAIVSLILLISLTSELSETGIGSTGVGMYIMFIGTIAAIALPFIPIAKIK